MEVNQQEIDAVDAKLNGQHGLKAALAVAFWSVPILVLWYWLYLYDDRFAPVMLALSGVDWHQYGASSFALNGATILAANGTTPFAPNRST